MVHHGEGDRGVGVIGKAVYNAGQVVGLCQLRAAGGAEDLGEGHVAADDPLRARDLADAAVFQNCRHAILCAHLVHRRVRQIAFGRLDLPDIPVRGREGLLCLGKAFLIRAQGSHLLRAGFIRIDAVERAGKGQCGGDGRLFPRVRIRLLHADPQGPRLLRGLYRHGLSLRRCLAGEHSGKHFAALFVEAAGGCLGLLQIVGAGRIEAFACPAAVFTDPDGLQQLRAGLVRIESVGSAVERVGVCDGRAVLRRRVHLLYAHAPLGPGPVHRQGKLPASGHVAEADVLLLPVLEQLVGGKVDRVGRRHRDLLHALHAAGSRLQVEPVAAVYLHLAGPARPLGDIDEGDAVGQADRGGIRKGSPVSGLLGLHLGVIRGEGRGKVVGGKLGDRVIHRIDLCHYVGDGVLCRFREHAPHDGPAVHRAAVHLAPVFLLVDVGEDEMGGLVVLFFSRASIGLQQLFQVDAGSVSELHAVSPGRSAEEVIQRLRQPAVLQAALGIDLCQLLGIRGIVGPAARVEGQGLYAVGVFPDLVPVFVYPVGLFQRGPHVGAVAVPAARRPGRGAVPVLVHHGLDRDLPGFIVIVVLVDQAVVTGAGRRFGDAALARRGKKHLPVDEDIKVRHLEGAGDDLRLRGILLLLPAAGAGDRIGLRHRIALLLFLLHHVGAEVTGASLLPEHGHFRHFRLFRFSGSLIAGKGAKHRLQVILRFKGPCRKPHFLARQKEPVLLFQLGLPALRFGNIDAAGRRLGLRFRLGFRLRFGLCFGPGFRLRF